jgi:rRNA-processing protein FCF1
MSETKKNNHRIKFHGLGDMSVGFYAGLISDILDSFDETRADFSVNDILELHNVLFFLQKGILPKSLSKKKQDSYKALIPKIHAVVQLFFNSLDEKNVETKLADINITYSSDLIALLSKHKVHERVDAPALLDALKKAGVSIAKILGNKDIVATYDQELRSRLISDANSARLLISKYFQKDSRENIIFPSSFTPNDARTLINDYIDSEDVNTNYLKLIVNSRVDESKGIDAKTKLKAKQKYQAWNDAFFKNSSSGISFGVGVKISDDQSEPVTVSEEDNATIFTYSKTWLDENSSPIAILNAFIETLGFVDKTMLLTAPSYTSSLGLFERFMEIDGKESYKTGISFQFKEMTLFYQTVMFDRYLDEKNENLEKVLEWFFNGRMKTDFKIEGFKYTPSTALSHLEKTRHAFIALDGMAKRYKLLVDDGSIDPELLKLTSKPISYKDIPSFMDGKYAYLTDHEDIKAIMHCLFSDQSSIHYISDELKGDDFTDLLAKNEISYDDFHDYQKPTIDHLISLDILKNVSSKIQFKSVPQIVLLRHLFSSEALSYYHYDEKLQPIIDDMVKKGWLTRETTLLTKPEASLFNYYLNQSEFSNGLDLRNRYIHDSQADEDDENAHYTSYIIAMELLISLVIKINNDILLRDICRMKKAK